MMRSLAMPFGLVAFAIGATACGGASERARAPEYDPADQTRAAAAKSYERPLVVEWPAADRAALEAQRAHGLVVVRYGGGQMDVLRGCHVASTYSYEALTPKEEAVAIRDRSELAAALPIHSASLEAKLTDRKSLEVHVKVVGMYEATQNAFRSSDLQGSCAGATHVVRAIAVGAFQISAASAKGRSGGVQVLGAGASASDESSHEVLNRDGDEASCARAAAHDAAPPFGCGALVRVEVTPILFPAAAGCGNGLVRKGNDCVAVAGDRPPLLDVLQSK